MQLGVEFSVEGLLVDRQVIDSGGNHLGVTGGVHGIDLDGDGGEQGPYAFDCRGQIGCCRQTGGLTGQQLHMTKASLVEDARFLFHLVETQGAAGHPVAGVEAAVKQPLMHSLDRQRCIELNGLAEALLGKAMGALSQSLKMLFSGRRQQGDKIIESQLFAGQGPLHIVGGCGHDSGLHRIGVPVLKFV
ncbi:MAG: hypothetical protein R2864_06785 [Syntrophotaleaceae bacterium]